MKPKLQKIKDFLEILNYYKINKLQKGWIRDNKEEDKQVFRWFVNEERDIIASVVEGYFPNESNLRVSTSTDYFESFENRGHKSIMLKKNDFEWIEDIERMIRRKIK